MSDFVQPIRSTTEFPFVSHKLVGVFMDKAYVQTLYGEQSASAVLVGNVYYNNQYSAPYNVSVSANYNAVANRFANVLENDWSTAVYQKFPGIWTLPSSTGDAFKKVALRFQQIKISSYYYNDDIANGSLRLYYKPIVASGSSVSAVQSQTTLQFFNIDDNIFGPTLSLSSDKSTYQNLSATTSAMTVDMLWRPCIQTEPGALWHRWTTSNSGILTSYSGSSVSAYSLYPSYSAEPYYGVGVFFNKLTPVFESNEDRPYLDLCVYGAASSTTASFINFADGLYNDITHTRFYLDQIELDKLFDGAFHHIKCAWSILGGYTLGKIYLDGVELNGVQRGAGRASLLDFTLSGNPSACATPLYIMSKLDNTRSTTQTSTKICAYGECKHFILSGSAFTGVNLSSSITSDSQIYALFGSLSSHIKSHISFNTGVLSQTSIVDKAYSLGLSPSSVTASIVNDVATAPSLEGKIDGCLSLLYDKRGSFPKNTFNVQANAIQQPIGFLYNSEYGEQTPQTIGVIFYDIGSALILNNHYNTQFGLTTQRFIEQQYASFSTETSTTGWALKYMSFIGRRASMRRIVSITANSGYFHKSTNITGLFSGTNGVKYTKSNKKYMTGIRWYGPKGIPFATTKFSEPIRKDENVDIVLSITFDF